VTHTPTPWIVEDGYIKCPKHNIGSVNSCRSTEGSANAKFIVRAVNAHDALVEALELHDEAARELHGTSYVNTDTQRKTVAALKLARGEK